MTDIEYMDPGGSVAEYSRNAIIEALEQNLWGMWSQFGLGPDCKLHNQDGVIRFDTPIATLPYNTVLRFDVEENPDTQIDAIIDHYRRRNIPFMWVVHPTTQPEDLTDRLVDRGIGQVDVAHGMAADLSELPEPKPIPNDVEIREVSGESDIEQLMEFVAWRWHVDGDSLVHLYQMNQAFEVGRPGSPVRSWLAWQGGVPVAKSVLYLSEEAAGLYGVVTRPEARGLGLGRRLTLEALQAGVDAGKRLGVLHSSLMARNLYLAMGFRDIVPFRIFASDELRI